jgi:hypothetical protein
MDPDSRVKSVSSNQHVITCRLQRDGGSNIGALAWACRVRRRRTSRAASTQPALDDNRTRWDGHWVTHAPGPRRQDGGGGVTNFNFNGSISTPVDTTITYRDFRVNDIGFRREPIATRPMAISSRAAGPMVILGVQQLQSGLD